MLAALRASVKLCYCTLVDTAEPRDTISGAFTRGFELRGNWAGESQPLQVKRNGHGRGHPGRFRVV